MVRFFAVVLLAGIGTGLYGQNPANNPDSNPNAAQAAPDPGAAQVEPLPAAPKGKSTILGGEIRFVDSVKDELLLKAYGQKPIKILFDERTQVFRDGKRIPLLSLGKTDHASIQTLLDGTNIFALSIHILSRTPQGDFDGKVVSFDPGSTELTLSSTASNQPLKLTVPSDTPITREGQSAFAAQHPGTADLVHGTLVTLKFESDNKGRGIARQITVFAVPGADFVFIGNITTLDLHTGHLVLADPRDDKTYDITFSSGIATQNLRQGDHVMVKARFDGNSYVATAISAE
jgi:hypothetical protein